MKINWSTIVRDLWVLNFQLAFLNAAEAEKSLSAEMQIEMLGCIYTELTVLAELMTLIGDSYGKS